MVTLPEFGKCKFFPALPSIVGRWTPEGDCRGFTGGGLALKIRARRKKDDRSGETIKRRDDKADT